MNDQEILTAAREIPRRPAGVPEPPLAYGSLHQCVPAPVSMNPSPRYARRTDDAT